MVENKSKIFKIIFTELKNRSQKELIKSWHQDTTWWNNKTLEKMERSYKLPEKENTFFHTKEEELHQNFSVSTMKAKIKKPSLQN